MLKDPDSMSQTDFKSVRLEQLLVPQRIEGRLVGGRGPSFGGRIFGGQAVGQALMAACAQEAQTGSAKLPHSLHCYFLKAGDSSRPLDFAVTTMTAGRSFATHHVTASQGEQTVFAMMASFHIQEPGFSHQDDAPLSLDLDAAIAQLDQWIARADAGHPSVVARLQDRPIELVPIHPGFLFGPVEVEPRTGWWLRMRQPVGADPAMQRALLAYASDMMLLRIAMLPHAIRPGGSKVHAASLDHAIWFHATPDMDDWLLFTADSPWAGHARGMNRGHFYTRDGTMVATVTQESLMRPMGEWRS